MMPDTFEGRQAYIEECERQMREQVAKYEASKAHYEWVTQQINLAVMQYNMAMTSLIYRAFFDPNFGAQQAETEVK